MYCEENSKIILKKYDLISPLKNYYYKTLTIFYIILFVSFYMLLRFIIVIIINSF